MTKVKYSIQRLVNVTSMHHLDIHKSDTLFNQCVSGAVVVKKKYVMRDDADENIARIFGQID